MVRVEKTVVNFIGFVESKALEATQRLEPDQVIEEFRETGHCSLSDDDLRRRFHQFRSHFFGVSSRSADEKLKFLYALSEPISKEFEKEMERGYDIELDEDRCIVRFQQKDHVVVEAPPPAEEPEDTPAPAPAVKNHCTILEDFLKEKCENALSVYTLSHLHAEFNDKFKTGMDYKTFWSKIRDHRREVPTRHDMDTNSKVRHLFALNGTVSAHFLKELRKNARVDIDNRNHITNYEANDGSLILEKQKSQQSVVEDHKKKRAAEKDSDDEEDEFIAAKKRMKRGPRIPPIQSPTTSEISRSVRRRPRVKHGLRGYSRENSPPARSVRQSKQRKAKEPKRKSRRLSAAMTLNKDEDEEMDIGEDVEFNGLHDEMDEVVERNPENNLNDWMDEDELEEEDPSTSRMWVRRSRRECHKRRENSVFVYPSLRKNIVRKAHRAPRLPPLRLSSVRSSIHANAPEDDYWIMFGAQQNQTPPPLSPDPFEEEAPSTRHNSAASQFSLAKFMASMSESGPIEYPEAIEDPVSMKMPEIMKVPESMEAAPIPSELTTSGHTGDTEEHSPIRSFSKKELQDMLSQFGIIPPVIQEATLTPEATPIPVNFETVETAPEVKVECVPEDDDIMILKTVKAEIDSDGFRVPELPPISEELSLEKHKKVLDSLKDMIRTLELQIPRKLWQQINSTIERIDKYGTREEAVTTGEIEAAVNSCLVIISKCAKSSTCSTGSIGSSSEENSISLRDFLLFLKNAIISMKSPFFAKFLETLKRSIQESQNKKIPMDKVQLSLQVIINIVAP